MILVTIQKTTNVELVCPIQHLPFGINKIMNGKRTECSFHNKLLVVVIVVVKPATAIIKQPHVFKLVVDS